MTIPARLFSSSVLLVAVCCVTLISILNGFFLHHQIYINNIININNIDEDFVLNLQEKNSVGGNAPVSTKPKFIVNNNDRDLEDNNMKLGFDDDDNFDQHDNDDDDKDFDQHDDDDDSKCRCVDCDIGEDNICGGLWRGNRYQIRNMLPSASDEKKIHIVVSHCKASLNWMPSYLGNLRNNVESIHVLSKCGQNVEGAPDNAEIQVIANVGRNDHSFAYYITSILPKLSTNDDSIVVFLKDTMMQNIFQGPQFNHTDLNSLVQLASSSNGFGCGLSIVDKSWSVYHDKNTLFTFALKAYEKGLNDYHTDDNVPFQSDKYSSVGDFYTSLNAHPLPALVQVCYGGMFAASIANIFKHDAHVWKAIEKSLLRGDNIIEGHYTERLWGALLATPLQQFQIDALWNYSTRVQHEEIAVHGALRRNSSNQHQQGQAMSSSKPRTVIFFNTYIHPNRTLEGQKIIRDQLWRINKQPLLEDTDIYYTRFGDINTTAWPETECVGRRKKRKCHQIKAVEKGDEVDAIQAVYEYCLQNNEDRVVYMHSKGSFTPTESNDRLRRFLMEAILSDECLNMPNDGSCSTCSTQFQPFPIFHYVGNMLVAECSYVKKLIPPKDFEKAKRRVVDTLFNATSPSLSLSTNITNEPNPIVYVTKIEGGDNPIEFQFRKKHVDQIQSEPCLGINRYAMEHYFLSHPEAKPCEVFSKMDPMTVPFSYNGIKTLDRNLYRIKKKILKPTLQKIPELVIEQNATDLILGNGFDYLHPFFLRNGRIFLYRALYPESMNALRKDSWLHVFLSNYSKFDDIGLTLRKIKFDDIDDFDQHDDDDDDDVFDQHDDDDDFDQRGDEDDDEFFNVNSY